MGDWHRRKSIKEAQQELAKNCGFGSDIIWDMISADDADVMKEKIKQLMPDQKKGQSTIEAMRRNLFNSVWQQRKYTNGSSFSSTFYVMVTKDERFSTPYQSTTYSFHPVFRCKKCDKDSDTSNCCMIYVDEIGRIYQNWNSYIKENVLPAGTMITPPKGIYNFNSRGEVILDAYCTPNGTPEAKAMRSAQTGSAVMGLGAACVPVVALALPVAAPIMAVAGIVGMGVGAFTAVTSYLHLDDRCKHGQSISMGNREARSCYLGILGGTVGMAAAGATRAMTSMASAGKATKGIEVLVNGMNISSLGISGSGVVNGVFELIFKFDDGDEISAMDVLQLSASLVLFTNSLYNFRLASQIANNARNNSIKSYRDTLSNRQRKMFDKMSKETMRIRGGTQGKMDIIQGANQIPDRQYLNDLYKINKQLNQQKVRPAFGKSGDNIVLNNEVPVKTAELRQNVQHQQGPNILSQVSQPIPTTHNSDTYTTQTPIEVKLFYAGTDAARNLDTAVNEDNWETSRNDLGVALKGGAILMFNQFGELFLKNISDLPKFKDLILSMYNHLSEATVKFVIELAQKFIEQHKQEIERQIKIYISTESVLYHIINHVLNKYSNLSYKFISQMGEEIITAVIKQFLTLNSTDPYGRRIRCSDCDGIRVISQL